MDNCVDTQKRRKKLKWRAIILPEGDRKKGGYFPPFLGQLGLCKLLQRFLHRFCGDISRDKIITLPRCSRDSTESNCIIRFKSIRIREKRNSENKQINAKSEDFRHLEGIVLLANICNLGYGSLSRRKMSS